MTGDQFPERADFFVLHEVHTSCGTNLPNQQQMAEGGVSLQIITHLHTVQKVRSRTSITHASSRCDA